jgi:transcriptional regulator with XRE-family HTH domain
LNLTLTRCKTDPVTPTDAEIRRAVARMQAALTAMARGEEPDEHPQDVLEEVVATIDADAFDPFTLAIGPDTITSRRMRELRLQSGASPNAPLRQEDLAEAMSQVGCDWRRGTVTETEKERRRLSLDELLGLALVFGVPVVELLSPAPGEVIEIGDGGPQLGWRQVRELLIGRGGKVGTGGPTWMASLVSKVTDRPARQLWARRRAAEKGE